MQTAPHIGNTGVNDDDDESARIWVAGYVVRDPARAASSWRAVGALEDRLATEGVVGVCGIDTRALTRHLRSRGAMRVGVSSVERDPARLLQRVLASPRMLGADLSAEVSTPRPYTVDERGEHRFTVAALDLGIKRNVARRLAARGVRVHVLPATSTMDELLAVGPDAVFFSPGPGDPATADHAVGLAREVLRRSIPLFGICFGSQVLGRALGFETYKLDYGHRGMNQPVLDRVTGRVEVTCHNHGFAVRAPLDTVSQTDFGDVEVSHVCLNDEVVEGLRCRDVPAFTVQYHPEAAAGPHDADHLFDRFAEMMHRRRRPDRGSVAPCLRATICATSSSSVPVRSSSVRRCEFDYSGTQACRVLRAEGLRVSLINSNPATIMTDPEFADATYVEPITPEFVELVIARERPDALLPTLGGQTALNTAVALHESGVLEKYGVRLIGADIDAIRRGEDRELFKHVVAAAGDRIGLDPVGLVPRSRVCHTLTEVRAAADELGLPVVDPSVVHHGRAGLRHGAHRRDARPHRRAPDCAPPRRARCSSRRACSGGRSSSSNSCATVTTTWWSSAPSRTSTRWGCTPATR